MAFEACDVAAHAEAAIAAELALAIEHRQAGQFDGEPFVAAVDRPRTVMPLQVSRVAIARATWPSGSRSIADAMSPTAGRAARRCAVPISAMNSSESMVKRPSASICQTKRSGWRRSCGRDGAASAERGCSRRSAQASGQRLWLHASIGGVATGRRRALRRRWRPCTIGAPSACVADAIDVIAGPASLTPRRHAAAMDRVAAAHLRRAQSSDVCVAEIGRAAGVAPISAPSSPNTATGSTQPASSRVTRSCQRKLGSGALGRGDQDRRPCRRPA